MITFDRLILYTKDVEDLKNFYQQHFNFLLVEEIKSEWVVLMAGQIQLAFHRVGKEYQGFNTTHVKHNNAKIVFTLQEDIYLLRAKLINHKVVMQEVKSYPGFRYLLCDGVDPEGNIFQLMQPNS